MTQDFLKLDKFDGGSFRRWQKKMHFLLTTLKVVYVLTTPYPQEKENETIAEERERNKWEMDDYICRGHILNALSDALFDVYQNVETAKELWTTLEAKYLAEDATSKKFIVSQFMRYYMVDSKPIMVQFHEIQNILNQFTQQNMKMDETIIVSSIIEKLPPSWKDYKKSLKHKKEDLTLQELAQHLRVEEESRLLEGKEINEIKDDQVTEKAKVLTIEEGKKSNYDNKRKRKFQSKGKSEKKKNKNVCWDCGLPGHFRHECRSKKGKKQKTQSDPKGKFVAVISEINLVDNSGDWWVDSGAMRHVCCDKSYFTTYEPVNDGSVLYMGNSTTAAIKGIGNVDLYFTSGNVVTLTNVCHVPEIRKNLVSGGLLNKHGFKLVFESDKVVVSKAGVFVGKGYLYDCMFKLNINKTQVSAYMVESFSLWHSRLGHVNTRKMDDMVNLSLIPKYDNDMVEKCKTCMQTKITRLPFPKVEKTTSLLELVHSDVCDMHSYPSIGRKNYFATFIDDYSKYCYVYLLHSKDEVIEKFKVYKAEVESQYNVKIKRLRSDRGGEYYFPDYCKSVGIIHEKTAPYTPQQNGVAERKNRTLTEMMNAMILYSGLSNGYWGEALYTASHILNRIPHKTLHVTPYELWKGRKPNISYFRTWGCRAIVKLPEPKRKKLGARGIECIFLGYALHSKAYRFMVIEPNDSVQVNTVIESRDAVFYENRFTTVPRNQSDSQVDPTPLESSQNEDHSYQNDKPSEPVIQRMSKRARVEKSFGPDFVVYLIEGTRESFCTKTMISLAMESDPLTYKEAMKSQDVAFWKEAIDDEMDSIRGNNTWVLSDLPPGSKPIGCKWIFKKKMKVDGTIDKFKARLVTKGFT